MSILAAAHRARRCESSSATFRCFSGSASRRLLISRIVILSSSSPIETGVSTIVCPPSFGGSLQTLGNSGRRHVHRRPVCLAYVHWKSELLSADKLVPVSLISMSDVASPLVSTSSSFVVSLNLADEFPPPAKLLVWAPTNENVPLSSHSNLSLSAPGVKSRMTSPVPTADWLTAVKTKTSAPAPPVIVSLPVPPVKRSLPPGRSATTEPLPVMTMTSAAEPPTTVSTFVSVTVFEVFASVSLSLPPPRSMAPPVMAWPRVTTSEPVPPVRVSTWETVTVPPAARVRRSLPAPRSIRAPVRAPVMVTRSSPPPLVIVVAVARVAVTPEFPKLTTCSAALRCWPAAASPCGHARPGRDAPGASLLAHRLFRSG